MKYKTTKYTTGQHERKPHKDAPKGKKWKRNLESAKVYLPHQNQEKDGTRY